MLLVNGAFRGQQVTGQQRYASEVVSALSRLGTPFYEISPESVRTGQSKLRSWAWAQTALPHRARGGTLLSLTSRAPFRHQNHVVTVHDLFPITHPEWYAKKYIAVHAPLLRHLLRTAAGIVTVSEPVADSIRRQSLTSDTTPVVVAPNAPSSSLASGGDSPVREQVEAIAQRCRYFLTVGSLDPRKNLDRILEAYLLLPFEVRERIPMVVVGGANSVFRAQHEQREDRTVVRLGYVSDAELARLYRGSSVLVSGSLDEGFGLPLVEAAAAGSHLAVSDIPVYRWVCGDAATYFDPKDINSMSAVLLSLASLDQLPDARPLPRQYSWEETAATITSLVRDLPPAGG